MEESVYIVVTGTQAMPGEEPSSEKIKDNARYFNRNKTHFVLIEDEVTAKCDRYKFNHRFLEVVRNGDINAKLYFEAGKTYTTDYRTPYGRMCLTFSTEQLTLFESDNEIHIDVKYKILNEDTLVSHNTIRIHVKPRKIS